MSSFNVILVGAGEINFGSVEGPWNHSIRLEKYLGARLKVLSIIDPDTSKSKARIQSKQADSSISNCYAETLCHASPQEASKHFNSKEKAPVKIDLIINGAPPHFRGTDQSGKDLDLVLLDCFPHAGGIFVEKPVSAQRPQESGIENVKERLKEWSDKTGGIVAVGYVLRYLKAVQKIRSIISSKSLRPMLISARYYMAYEHAVKLSWWNKRVSCGPVVEQATHFVDLLRYFGGEIDKESISCQTVEWFEKPGQLAKVGFNEKENIKEEDRIPRATSSIWKFENGGIGQLNHVVGLHGNTYDTEFEIVADGWMFRLKSAYSKAPRLYTRELGAEEEEVEIFEGDDPFLSEIISMVDAIETKSQRNGAIEPKQPLVLSSFEDAMKTYEITWAIREKGEESVLENLGKRKKE